MNPSRCLLAAFGWVLAGAVSAQGTASSPVRAGTDSAGLERAQRLAANPMRIILEAGRAPQRPAASEAPARAGAGPTPTRTPAVGEPAVAVILRLPATLDQVPEVGQRFVSLAPPPPPMPPLVLDALRMLPWPSELAPAAGEPTGPRRLAGPAAELGRSVAQQFAQAETDERP